MPEHRSLSKQELISAATKVDSGQRYYIGVAREKRRRYERAAAEGDAMCRFGLEMKKSQKDGLNEIVGTWIDECGKQIVPDMMLEALNEYERKRQDRKAALSQMGARPDAELPEPREDDAHGS